METQSYLESTLLLSLGKSSSPFLCMSVDTLAKGSQGGKENQKQRMRTKAILCIGMRDSQSVYKELCCPLSKIKVIYSMQSSG